MSSMVRCSSVSVWSLPSCKRWRSSSPCTGEPYRTPWLKRHFLGTFKCLDASSSVVSCVKAMQVYRRRPWSRPSHALPPKVRRARKGVITSPVTEAWGAVSCILGLRSRPWSPSSPQCWRVFSPPGSPLHVQRSLTRSVPLVVSVCHLKRRRPCSSPLHLAPRPCPMALGLPSPPRHWDWRHRSCARSGARSSHHSHVARPGGRELSRYMVSRYLSSQFWCPPFPSPFPLGRGAPHGPAPQAVREQ
jgi:hypothetical protein